jgi:hypothetical protein
MERLVNLPSRLHHTAYVTRDLEATRQFYEDTIGLPLIATWCENDMLFGAERTYCHELPGNSYCLGNTIFIVKTLFKESLLVDLSGLDRGRV